MRRWLLPVYVNSQDNVKMLEEGIVFCGSSSYQYSQISRLHYIKLTLCGKDELAVLLMRGLGTVLLIYCLATSLHLYSCSTIPIKKITYLASYSWGLADAPRMIGSSNSFIMQPKSLLTTRQLLSR
jgi:hypothetical protein